jgi:predicted enzyme related to lactoylglutathione lyase
MRHFSFTKLIVNDLEKSAAFYKSVAGLTEQARIEAVMEGRAIKEIMFNPTAPGAAMFVLLTYPNGPKLVHDTNGSAIIMGFVTDDIDAFVKNAEKAGGRVTEQPSAQPAHGVKVAFVRDPEGHLIEVVEPLK